MAVSKVVYDGKTLIDLTADTVAPETLAKGATAHDMSGAPIVGTMEAGAKALTVSNTSFSYTASSKTLTIRLSIADCDAYCGGFTVDYSYYYNYSTKETVFVTARYNNSFKAVFIGDLTGAGSSKATVTVSGGKSTVTIKVVYPNTSYSQFVHTSTTVDGIAV